VSAGSRLRWYVRRATRMSSSELAWRARDQALRAAWRIRQVRGDQMPGHAQRPAALPGVLARGRRERRFTAVLPPATAGQVPLAARVSLLAAADQLMRGEWEVFGVTRTDLAAPDWFLDPVTGRRAPASRYAFLIDHRSQDVTGNVKQVWEISRLQHLTLLATAWFIAGDDAYAVRVAEQLRSWWRENRFLSGVNWTSGIEVGVRLIALAWIRRLLDGWPGVADLFESDELAVRQIRWHQQYLAAFRSRGSSANNHVIAEAAGQLVASCAFDWFPGSGRWRRESARVLERELIRNTFPCGLGRELASDYHAFVAELGLLAAAEAAVAGRPLSDAAWRRLCAMIDSGAALLDERHRPPRQGDGDQGRALLAGWPAESSWPSLLTAGEAAFGRLCWWPPMAPDAAGVLIGALAGPVRDAGERPARRPWRFPDAGITLLRAEGGGLAEIWCRCDGGPHGYLSIAAHAHADALSVEVRHGGVDVLADPGTYCYHGELDWRSYFRSTIAHNTVEIDGRNQSVDGGPFLWLRQANATEIRVRDAGAWAEWVAEQDGYRSLDRPAGHRRHVKLDRAARSVAIVDQIDGGEHDVRIAFHLGPDVLAELDGTLAILTWPGSEGCTGSARLRLPGALTWSLHRSETNPILGWYSSGLGRRTPAWTLLGTGRTATAGRYLTSLEFLDAREPGPISYRKAAT
jgi:hypothetical protein